MKWRQQLRSGNRITASLWDRVLERLSFHDHSSVQKLQTLSACLSVWLLIWCILSRSWCATLTIGTWRDPGYCVLFFCRMVTFIWQFLTMVAANSNTSYSFSVFESIMGPNSSGSFNKGDRILMSCYRVQLDCEDEIHWIQDQSLQYFFPAAFHNPGDSS